jgi:hypothetical protein
VYLCIFHSCSSSRNRKRLMKVRKLEKKKRQRKLKKRLNEAVVGYAQLSVSNHYDITIIFFLSNIYDIFSLTLIIIDIFSISLACE